jgi:hypothetical protein
MKTAEKAEREGRHAESVKILKKAEKENERLVRIDRDVRDPLIEKCKEKSHGKMGESKRRSPKK